MAKRKQLRPDEMASVPMQARRRCCLCFYYDGDMKEKDGQVAHVDRDPANNAPENLAWLCLPHHDRYDGKTSQSKNFTPNELKECRRELLEHIAKVGFTAYPTAVPVQERRRQVERERADFERQVADNSFYKFRADAAILAVSIFPFVSPEEPVELTSRNDQVIRAMIQPMVSGDSPFQQIQIGPKAIICPPDMEDGMTIPPEGTTALNEGGSVFAVRNLNHGRDSRHDFYNMLGMQSQQIDITKPYAKPVSKYQPQLINSVRRYLSGLSKLGLEGPWRFGLSIQKARNLQLMPGGGFGRGLGRPCENETMKADTIEIPATVDLSSDKAVGVELVRSLKAIWKYCGHPSTPEYDSDESWKRVD